MSRNEHGSEDVIEETWQYNADGTYQASQRWNRAGKLKIEYELSGEWRLDGDELTLDKRIMTCKSLHPDSDGPKTSTGGPHTIRIFWVNDDEWGGVRDPQFTMKRAM